jgi:hypothetical protein
VVSDTKGVNRAPHWTQAVALGVLTVPHIGQRGPAAAVDNSWPH